MRVVSACLAGICCRYDGKNSSSEKVIEMIRRGEAIPVCPEQLGGLPTPREPAELKDGKVITQSGRDITAFFEQGALEAVKIVELVRAKEVILKARSPSCGSGNVYDGSFSGKLVVGDGIFAALLKKKGIKLFSEEDI
ncbi:DUF523 domain-containing protein [Candidatus Woesearchaeota archaeon]|nr:DUF523 domain-containing protein [Candidatus Woesearchaeota archaeon]